MGKRWNLYRITQVPGYQRKYRVQILRWWWPVWRTENEHFYNEIWAEEWIETHRNKVVKYVW